MRIDEPIDPPGRCPSPIPSSNTADAPSSSPPRPNIAWLDSTEIEELMDTVLPEFQRRKDRERVRLTKLSSLLNLSGTETSVVC